MVKGGLGVGVSCLGTFKNGQGRGEGVGLKVTLFRNLGWGAGYGWEDFSSLVRVGGIAEKS